MSLTEILLAVQTPRRRVLSVLRWLAEIAELDLKRIGHARDLFEFVSHRIESNELRENEIAFHRRFAVRRRDLVVAHRARRGVWFGR